MEPNRSRQPRGSGRVQGPTSASPNYNPHSIVLPPITSLLLDVPMHHTDPSSNLTMMPASSRRPNSQHGSSAGERPAFARPSLDHSVSSASSNSGWAPGYSESGYRSSSSTDTHPWASPAESFPPLSAPLARPFSNDPYQDRSQQPSPTFYPDFPYPTPKSNHSYASSPSGDLDIISTTTPGIVNADRLPPRLSRSGGVEVTTAGGPLPNVRATSTLVNHSPATKLLNPNGARTRLPSSRMSPSDSDSSPDTSNPEPGASRVPSTEPDEEDGQDPRVIKRRHNTLSARKSRKRKTEYVNWLEGQVDQLTRERDTLKGTAARLEEQTIIMGEMLNPDAENPRMGGTRPLREI